MKRVILLSIIFMFSLAWTDAAEKKAGAKKTQKNVPDPAFAKVEDQPGLPRVLLIGDSISIGYTVPARKLLKGKANVHRIPVNGGPTVNGLKNLKAWLGNAHWDVIHFNWGLHDLKYVGTNSDVLADPKLPTSHHQVPLEQYEKNLTELVKQLQATGAKLIWCTTTPVPEGAAGRIPGDEVKYNEAAARIMKSQDIAINDLCTHAMARLKEIQLPANVHFTNDGSLYLAQQVVKSIDSRLPDKK